MDFNAGNIVLFGLIVFYIAQFWDGHVRHQEMLRNRKNKLQETL